MKLYQVIMLVICGLSSMCKAANAPGLSRSGPEKVVVYKGQNVTLTASGGTTDEPSGGCPPWTQGTLQYVFTYSTLSGTPSSGSASSSSSLSIKRDSEGQSSVTAYVQQEWTDSKGSTKTQKSGSSTSVNVEVQKPSSISFVSSSKVSGGGAFKFNIKDTKGNALANAPVDLKESAPFNAVAYDANNNVINVYTGTLGPDSASGTDGAGNMIDQPVGATEGTLKNLAINHNTNVLFIMYCAHLYTSLVGPDSTSYSLNYLQNQTIKQQVILTVDSSGLGAANVSTVSVSP